MTAERIVDARSEEYVERYCALDPLTATYIGVAGHDHELPDLSPSGFEAREELTRSAYSAVEASNPADERERVARDAFLERLGLDLELVDAGFARSQMNVIESPLHELRMVFDLMPTDGEQAWSDIESRLAGIPEALAGYRTTLTEEAAAGRVAAQRQYVEVAEQVRNWTGQQGLGGDFFAGLVAGAPDDARGRLTDAAGGASAAFAEFGRFLETDLAPLGREREAVGRERYALESRRFLGATIDLEETYAWGWEELKRLSDDIAATADRILPGATAVEAVAHLDADPSTRIVGKEAFRDWMQDLADRTVAELDGVHFDIPDEIRRIECCLAPTNDGGIYYTGPSEDFVRPGRMWWAVPDGQTEFSPWREMTTVYHEGVPGHHLQVGQTAVRKDLLNRWQRLMCWVSGHGEGWALYAERLMDDLGYLSDPGRPARDAGRPVAPGGPRDHRHRDAPRARRSRPTTRSASTPARPGRPSSAGTSWVRTAGSSRPSSTSRSSATSAGRARRRRTRSASGSGCRLATRPAPGPARPSTSRPSTARRWTWAPSVSTR